MDQPPCLDTVYQAVYTLYHNSERGEKEQASKWLEQLQKSVYAWKIADEMLHSQRDLECSYFAAQTMRTKVQLSFHELPQESYISLRDSLLEHITRISQTTNTVIVIQLCLAIADLALQMTSWESPVVDLISRLGGSCPALLELLVVLPEEVNSRALRLGANRREEFIKELSASVPTVLDYLKACLANYGDDVNIQIKALRCFTSWINVEAVDLVYVPDSPVVSLAFQVLMNRQQCNDVHEAAGDCLCYILKRLVVNNNSQAEFEKQLFAGVIALEQSYHLAVAHEELDKCVNYCRIFTELAESLLYKIITVSATGKPHFAMKIFDLVLMCVGHHDYEVSEITFNLWYSLSEELYQKNNDSLTSLFKHYIERLIGSLCRHCQMEPDNEGLPEVDDDFPDFRNKVSDLIKDVVHIVGSSNCFKQMYLSLQAPNSTWDSVEAALFIMQAFAKHILPEENDVVPKVVEALITMDQSTHIAVRNTSLLLLSELCEWIEKHPQYLESILNLAVYSLEEGKVSGAAAVCLQSICSSSQVHMTKQINLLLQILHSLNNINISNEASIGLIKGVSTVVSKLPADQIQPALKELCLIQVNPLCQLIESGVKPERGTKSDPSIWLDRLTAVFKDLNVEVINGEVHPCQPVFTQIWPVLSSVWEKYLNESHIIERSCRCLRFAIRRIGKHSAPLIEPIVKQMVHIYSIKQHSCFLYVGSILVDEHHSSEWLPGLMEMLQAFMGPTFELLSQPDGLRNHPDTIDDLFRLCSRFLQRAGVALLTSPTIEVILGCALMAITLDHRDANASVMKFFFDLVRSARNYSERSDFHTRKQLVCKILDSRGQELINNLMNASVFCLQTYMLAEVADVFMEISLLDKQKMSVWLENALKMMPTQNRAGTVTATAQQLQDFHTSVLSAESPKALGNILKKFARLYR